MADGRFATVRKVTKICNGKEEITIEVLEKVVKEMKKSELAAKQRNRSQ